MKILLTLQLLLRHVSQSLTEAMKSALATATKSSQMPNFATGLRLGQDPIVMNVNVDKLEVGKVTNLAMGNSSITRDENTSCHDSSKKSESSNSDDDEDDDNDDGDGDDEDDDDDIEHDGDTTAVTLIQKWRSRKGLTHFLLD